MISLLLCSFLSTAQAVPMQLSQQGRLVDSSGVAASGNHNLTFRLYNAGTGGTLLWNETISTNFTNGYYSVVLGSDTINNPLEDSVLESGDLFIEIEIDSDGPLTPRSAVTSAPFARVAGKAQSADWGGLTSIPADIDDGDDDTMGGLSCSDGEQPVYSSTSGAWTCGNPVVDVDADNRLAALETLVASLQNDLATTQSDLATANTTIASLQSSVGTNTTDIASNASDITGLDTDLTAAEGNITSLQASVTTNTTDIAALQSDVTTLQGSVLDLIDTDTTWNIGSTGDYTNLADAMAAARSVQIHPDATLTLQFLDGVYSSTQEISLNHPQGKNIHIQGNSSDKGAVELYFNGGSDGLVVVGHTIGLIQDLTIRGNSTASSVGVYIQDTGIATLADIDVEDFGAGLYTINSSRTFLNDDNIFQNNLDHGLVVRFDSSLFGDNAVTTNYNGVHGVLVGEESFAYLTGLTSTYNGASGIRSWVNSSVSATNSDLSYNTVAGIQAYDNGMVYAAYSDISNNQNRGVMGYFDAYINVMYSTIHNHPNYGIDSHTGTHINARYSTISSTGHGAICNRLANCDVRNVVFSNNTAWDINTYRSSFVFASGATFSGANWSSDSTSEIEF